VHYKLYSGWVSINWVGSVIIDSSCAYAFSALMLLFAWQEGHLAYKNLCFKTPWDGG